ncbi:Glycosyltransferase involved in cell wall bisynthesis [Flavobacterium micromati]|jgi:glycosyltransferase involved in cell wall biosynthesis|uniref:Glycosyltransferase involved in cell wall bisynthesis n=1 Tax=Flavobacterium micromati TaxID=229205 RepID=A0A1M5N5T1_9FLAO|nr:glycosyltransferase family 2 protein [Flavobacterium micromati]SHG84817.1 Glycosyltransferase involved in cell wall bisynthesis [Flavobacterium micromati]
MTKITVIIPAYNEEKSIGKVIQEIPKIVSEIIVINNNSTDATAQVAFENGATVLAENRKGYGYACLKGLEYIAQLKTKPDIVVFLDGDYSDYPQELTQIITPILEENIDFVVGARVPEFRENGSMTPQQVFGNWLATTLMKSFFGATFTDLGPFRAIKYQKLVALQMEDKTYGWTVEMQLKVLKQKMTYVEIPVHYKNRIGVSKVSGTLKGTVMAGVKIIGWIFKYAFK